MMPRTLYMPGWCEGTEPHTLEPHAKNDMVYISKEYLLRVLRRERLSMKKHLEDSDWREDWPALRRYIELYDELIWRLNKLK